MKYTKWTDLEVIKLEEIVGLGIIAMLQKKEDFLVLCDRLGDSRTVRKGQKEFNKKVNEMHKIHYKVIKEMAVRNVQSENK